MLAIERWCRKIVVRWVNLKSAKAIDWRFGPLPHIAQDIEKDVPVYGYRFRGQRFDCGSKAGFLQATVAFGLARDDLRGEFDTYLREMMSMQQAAQ